jgi:hypothetical protein
MVCAPGRTRTCALEIRGWPAHLLVPATPGPCHMTLAPGGRPSVPGNAQTAPGPPVHRRLHARSRYRLQRPPLPLALGRVGRPDWPPCAGIAMSSTSEASADGYSDQRRDHSAAPDDTGTYAAAHVGGTEGGGTRGCRRLVPYRFQLLFPPQPAAARDPLGSLPNSAMAAPP